MDGNSVLIIFFILFIVSMFLMCHAIEKSDKTKTDKHVYVIRKKTDIVENSVKYKVLEERYAMGVGYYYDFIKSFDNEKAAMSLIEKLEDKPTVEEVTIYRTKNREK